MKYSIWCIIFGHKWFSSREYYKDGHKWLEKLPNDHCNRCGLTKKEVGL